MIIQDFAPSYFVKDYIQCYRIIHFVFKENEIPVKFYPPKPENCLHFFIDGYLNITSAQGTEEVYRQPVFSGIQTIATTRITGKNIFNFQIVFQPGAVYRLTGIPSNELTDSNVYASDILSDAVIRLNDNLCAANSYTSMIALADNFIRNLIRREKNSSHRIDKIITNILAKENNYSVEHIAKEAFLCSKQFKRKFLERTGVNPITYLRIVRFNKAFNIRNRYPYIPWLRVAMECNYCDYQHLAKDYKDFTGLSPEKFHNLERNAPESILGLAEQIYNSRCSFSVR